MSNIANMFAKLFHPYSWQEVSDIEDFCGRQFHHIFSYHQQPVSDIAHCVKCSLITSFPITNRMWVTLHSLWKAVTSHISLSPTGCEWHCTFCERQPHHIFSYDQQQVSEIAHFVKGSLITSFPITNRMWVTLHTLWKLVLSHPFLWPTVCEWNCSFCVCQSHHIVPYDQQLVSDIRHFVKVTLVISFPMTNSLWVTLHILWKAVITSFLLATRECVTLHILWKAIITSFLWPIVCEWYCTFCERQSHSYDQQPVSDIAILWKAISFPMTNSLWVMVLHILWEAASALITSFTITNSMWITLHILWKAVSSHLFLWPTVCEWHYTLCERQSHHIFSDHQQFVSCIMDFQCEMQSCDIFFYDW